MKDASMMSDASARNKEVFEKQCKELTMNEKIRLLEVYAETNAEGLNDYFEYLTEAPARRSAHGKPTAPKAA